MPNIRYINKAEQIDVLEGWVRCEQFKSLGDTIDESGNRVEAEHEGRKYKVVGKLGRDYTTAERVGRGLIGTILAIISLGLLLLCKPVRNLFCKERQTLIYALLFPSAVLPGLTEPAPVDSLRVEEPSIPPQKSDGDISGAFSDIDSESLFKMATKTKTLDRRAHFFTLKKTEGYTTAPPIIAKSPFVSDQMVQHLMSKKKDSAIAVKYVAGDEITNMEGAMHTFVTPLAKIHMTGDYAYKAGHSINLFGNHQVRPVILSAAIQPDFEDHAVMVALTKLTEVTIEGAPLEESFAIPSAEEKSDPATRLRYDAALKRHLIYHLTRDHRLPALNEIDQSNILNYEESLAYLEQLIIDECEAASIPDLMRGIFVQVKGSVLSLEVLLNSYIHQLHNEFKVLEKAAPQGYLYTLDPPAIFAAFFGNATLLNRLQIAAFKVLSEEGLFKNLQRIGYNDYADKGALKLLAGVMGEIPVESKSLALAKCKGLALVLHNNSDAFGQNIETEGPTSMDGVIGCYSDAALVLSRSREDLLSTVI